VACAHMVASSRPAVRDDRGQKCTATGRGPVLRRFEGSGRGAAVQRRLARWHNNAGQYLRLIIIEEYRSGCPPKVIQIGRLELLLFDVSQQIFGLSAESWVRVPDHRRDPAIALHLRAYAAAFDRMVERLWGALDSTAVDSQGAFATPQIPLRWSRRAGARRSTQTWP
jgi:hypothetical protein